MRGKKKRDVNKNVRSPMKIFKKKTPEENFTSGKRENRGEATCTTALLQHGKGCIENHGN